MAQLGQVFNAQDLPEAMGFDPLPAGWYQADISESELKDTAAGNGQYIKLKLTITGPTHQGRVVFTNLNIRNPNPKAEEIGLGQLRSLMAAIGLASVQDTDQLIGGSCEIKLTIKQSEQYGPQNEVKGFKAIGGAGSSMPAPAANAESKPAAAAAKPPWQK
jgi:hypothetical protein